MKPTVFLAAVAGIFVSVLSPALAVEPLLTPPQLAKLGYVPYWAAELDLNRGGFVKDGHLVEDSLYLVTDYGEVHAVQAVVGLARWWQKITESVYDVFKPTHFVGPNGERLAVFTSTPRTMIIDRDFGDIIADMPLDRATASPTVADEDTIYFGSFDGHFYAMFWNDPRTSRPVLQWRVMAGGPVTSAPALIHAGEDLVFASNGGTVYCCTTNQKILNWAFPTGGPITGDIVVHDEGTFVASTDRSLYRVETLSGALQWRARFSEPLRRGPIVAGDAVYQYSPKEGVAAVNAETGEILWNLPEAEHFLCRTVDRVYLLTGRRRMIMADAASGEVLTTVQLPPDIVSIPNAADPTMYLANAHGQLLCAKPSGTPPISPEAVAEAKRALRRRPGASLPPAAAEDVPLPPPEVPEIDLRDPLRSRDTVPPVGTRPPER